MRPVADRSSFSNLESAMDPKQSDRRPGANPPRNELDTVNGVEGDK